MEDERARRTGERLAILEPILAALQRPHEVLDAVYSAPTPAAARAAVEQLLDVSAVGAVAVLDTQLRRFDASARAKIADERSGLLAQLDDGAIRPAPPTLLSEAAQAGWTESRLLDAADTCSDPTLVDRLHAVAWPDVPLETFRAEMARLVEGLRRLAGEDFAAGRTPAD
jgi:hypothetical protein